MDIDSERSSCCSRSENVVESASARHTCTLWCSRSLCRSHQTLPPWFWCQIFIFLLHMTTLAVHSAHSSPASTSGGGAMAMDPNSSPTDSWKGPARQQRRSLSLDKRSPRPRPHRLMQSIETCTGCFFVEGEAMSFFFMQRGVFCHAVLATVQLVCFDI